MPCLTSLAGLDSLAQVLLRLTCTLFRGSRNHTLVTPVSASSHCNCKHAHAQVGDAVYIRHNPSLSSLHPLTSTLQSVGWDRLKLGLQMRMRLPWRWLQQRQRRCQGCSAPCLLIS